MENARIYTAVQFNQEIITSLARVSELVNSGPLTQRYVRSEPSFDVGFEYEKQIDIPAERERLSKDLAKHEKALASAERQLNNPAFLAKAPAHIVEGLKKQEADTRLLLDKTRTALEELK